MMRRLLLVVALALLVYGALLAWLYWRQERLLFMPQPLPAAHRFALGDDVHELQIEVPGARLSALHLRLPAPRGLVFFLHGNAGNLDTWFVNADFYRRAGYDLFMLDYRGYGKSSGRIDSEAQLRADVRAAWEQVAPRYQGLRRVIYGRSLGTALASGLAAEVRPELTVLVSPYASMAALMRLHYPWVPGRLLRYPLDTAADVARTKGPVLLLHGEQDALIPPQQAEQLLAHAPQARLLRIAGAGHNDLQNFEAYLQAMREALRGP
ncbi:alpha/beta fold hydrolase [Paucibacter sp. PLA-PC-4]|uniref:alpha/beta hydrolase n=1 Tax=Paucibacter sp. PLA-PC-4 TaxID=2993655 RepID=UPI0022496488|nr:alpha/beta fold hydrolase [Paucibacter sp. PLA-PC-4]MCX2862876.1 alpha/beta fold hydrolase [Paucibacter sp. PLA-PC-4]